MSLSLSLTLLLVQLALLAHYNQLNNQPNS
jgi:hypothetical protein